MNETKKAHITATEKFVQDTLHDADGSHDWQHIVRVRKLAEHLAVKEGVDMYVVSLGALLHDIADHKYHDGDKELGPRVAREWLTELGVPGEAIENIVDIVANISFSGQKNGERMKTMEGSVVRDADRLDALGAVGIARTFTYGGTKNRPLYNPAVPPSTSDGESTVPTINHFHEKLFKLKELMETSAGRAVAEERHAYMEEFLKQFWRECEGEA